MMDQLILGDEEISSWIKKSRTIHSVVRLPGDASTRRYYRVISDMGNHIVMRMEPFSKPNGSTSFLDVQKFLAASGVDVPAVIDVDPGRGFILLEDLGDVTLLKKLQDVRTPDIERHLYERAIDSLVQLQVVSQEVLKKTSASELQAFSLNFDHEKLMWEMNFTIENFYEGYLKRKITDPDHRILTEGLSGICTLLAEQPRVLTHRDFHSRNIMITQCDEDRNKGPNLGDNERGERLVMIDFQDARMGPPQYDLASLLKDSYYQLEESQITILKDYYIAKYEAMAGISIDKPHFTMIFDLMSVQRNFKAIGSFASFMTRRGDPTYLKYIGNTFENIRKTLLKYPQYSKLREILFNYYYF